jgi:hypothetical protein
MFFVWHGHGRGDAQNLFRPDDTKSGIKQRFTSWDAEKGRGLFDLCGIIEDLKNLLGD